MKRTAVLNVVGLSESLIGEATPRISGFRNNGELARIRPALPAVTCPAQSNYLTGRRPCEHGVVANGWYNRELAEVHFWKQSNHLVASRKLWDALRQIDPRFTCAQLFWWFNMYSSATWSITPRPIYPADGRKIFDIYAWPYSLRTEIKKDLGEFPFPAFWGPAAGVASARFSADAVSHWIARSAKWVEERYAPTLSLVYLPHLDYNLQRLGPLDPEIRKDLRRIDQIVGDLLDFFSSRSVQVVLLSEYGISPVSRPIHLNRVFREAGWLTVKEELGRELIDFGASRVFAVADHQAAHVYVQDESLRKPVRALLEKQEGVAEVWGAEEKKACWLEHARSGELVVFAAEGSWFTYYYWLDERRAPDFARTVDIHRKPGYDPVELFLDPQIAFVKGRIAWRLLEKRLGFRMLMDVIPLDATLVKGSHGRLPEAKNEWPVLITQRSDLLARSEIDSTEVFGLLQVHSRL